MMKYFVLVLFLLVPVTVFAQSTPQRSPAVLAALEMPQSTPAEQLTVVLTLVDLGETELAAEEWKNVQTANLEDAQLAALARQLGTARLLQLARQELSGASEFVEKCLDAAAAEARDPRRLARLVQDLHDDSAAVRQAARVDLAATSTAGGKACLESLAQASDESHRANLMIGLAQLRPEVDPQLLAVLADGRGQVRRDVAELAGHIDLAEAAPWLAALAAGASENAEVAQAASAALVKLGYSAPNKSEARRMILKQLHRLDSGVAFDRRPLAESDVWWTFDPASRTLTSETLPLAKRRLLAVERLARLLVELPNATNADRQLALVYAYQVARELGKSVPADLETWGESLSGESLNSALAEAMETDSVLAAIACVELLGQREDASVVSGRGGMPAPLVMALGHADRDLRFAALKTIMQLAPQKTFSGASQAPKALWYFAAAAGQPQAVVAASHDERAFVWAGQLRTLGYDATPTGSGREALQVALASPRLALVLVDCEIGQPQLREVIFQLRSSQRTRRVPTAVLCSLPGLPRARQLAAEDNWLLATPRPHDADAMRSLVDSLTVLGSDLSPETRLAQAEAALNWIAELLAAGHPYDELLRGEAVAGQVVFVPELTEAALRVLARLGTASSQQMLVALASSGATELTIRRQAATAFAESVARVGPLLTTDEIALQFDRYNASETADAATQEVLGSLLDTLEGKP